VWGHHLNSCWVNREYISNKQCCGSGSGGSICFWASEIRIHLSEKRIRILLSSSKNSKKKHWFLLFCDFFMNFYLWKMM
jgi:hypothetical protein